MNSFNAVKAAVKRIGSQQKVADRLGVSRQAVKMWVKSGSVSRDYVVPFCRLTGENPRNVSRFAAEILDLCEEAALAN